MSAIGKQNITQKDILDYLCDEQWSNAACCGYVILACENLGYNKKQIEHLINSMQDAFNLKTVEQAKQKYHKY